MEMRQKIFPVCEKCDTVMNPLIHENVAPGFVVNGDCYCASCFKEYINNELDWLKSQVDKDPEAVAQAMGIAVIDVPEG